MTQLPFFTPAEDAARVDQILAAPLVLTSGQSIVNKNIIVPADFPKAAATHAVTMHPAGNLLQNVQIIFETDHLWLARWLLALNDQPAVGISSYVSGLCMPATANAVIDGLHVVGAPRYGIEAWDISNLNMQRFSVTRCNQGANFREISAVNTGLVVDQFRGWDTWGPDVGVNSPPSQKYPGRFVGGNLLVSNSSDTVLSRFDISGELFEGAKIGRGSGVELTDWQTPCLMLQGRSTAAGYTAGDKGLRQCRIRNLFINAATGYGRIANAGNKLQISWGVQAVFEDGGYVFGNGDGNCVQVTGDCHVKMTDYVMGGATGTYGGLPACALELDENDPISTINRDFETQNKFIDQPVKLRRAA